MDNSKRPGNRSNGSIDGFTRPAKQIGNKPNSLRNFDQHYRGASTSETDSYRVSKIDNFKSPDGFVFNTQAPISNPSDAYKPADIGEINAADSEDQSRLNANPPEHRRKGFMFFRRKQKEPKKNKNHRKLRIGLKAA